MPRDEVFSILGRVVAVMAGDAVAVTATAATAGHWSERAIVATIVWFARQESVNRNTVVENS